MKIDDTYTNMTLMGNSKEAAVNKSMEERTAQTTGSDKREESGAEIDFSKTSVEFSRAAAAVEKDATKRADRINLIKTQVTEGTYEMDATRIAEKILKDAISTLKAP